MLRAHRQPAKSGRGQLLVHPALVHGGAGARFDPALQVDAPPAHHPVCGRVGTLAHHARGFRLLSRAQARRGPDRATAGQPFQPFGVVAVNPVPQPLPVRPAAPGGGFALCPPRHQRDRQHAPRRPGILRLRRRCPKLTRRQIPSCDRNRPQNLRAPMEQNHSGKPTGPPPESRTGVFGMTGHPLSPSRICFSISISAKKAAPTATINSPSTSRTGLVPSTACKGGR